MEAPGGDMLMGEWPNLRGDMSTFLPKQENEMNEKDHTCIAMRYN